jgi:hypothetical protein
VIGSVLMAGVRPRLAVNVAEEGADAEKPRASRTADLRG